MIRTVDYAPLSSVVTKQDVTAYRAELARTKPNANAGNWVGAAIVIVVLVVFGFMFVSILVPVVLTMSQSVSSSGGFGGMVIAMVVPAIILAGLVVLVVA